MVEGYLSEQTFGDGIRSYMEENKWGNATGDDLWGNLQKASGQPIDALMKTWLNEPGYPLVNAETRREGDKLYLDLSQRRFFSDPAKMKEGTDQTWPVPMVIRYGTAKGEIKTMRALFSERNQSIELPADATWVYPNGDSLGFYRTKFSAKDLAVVIEQGLPYMTPAERKSLIEDERAMLLNGESTFERFMEVLSYFSEEDDYVVTKAITSSLKQLKDWVGPEDESKLAQFATALMAEQLEDVGLDADPRERPARSVRRSFVFEALGKVAEDDRVLQKAEEVARQEREDPKAANPDTAQTLLTLAALRGGVDRLEQYVATLNKRQKANEPPDVQNRYLRALGSFEDPKAVERLLSRSLDGDIPQQSLNFVYNPLLRNPETQIQTWEFLKTNWKAIQPRMGNHGVMRLVKALGGMPADRKGDIAEFFAKNPAEGTTRTLKQALEEIDLEQQLKQRARVQLRSWFRGASFSAMTA